MTNSDRPHTPNPARRRILQAGGLGFLALLSNGTVTAQTQSQTTGTAGFQPATHLMGARDARPAPNSGFFDDKTRYEYVYEDYNGQRSHINHKMNQWEPVNFDQQITVFDSSDLPKPTNGTHTLEDHTAYIFNGFVTSEYGLELGESTPLIGRHGSLDGFIHTGGETAITGTDAGFFARDAYFHAPGGTLLNLTADQTTEMLVESCSISDAADIAPISSLGQITGYCVPTFKGCNFEDFNGGLTFDGDPDKIFIWGSPLRKVATSGVTIFTLKSTSDAQIVDFVDNYVKDVQPDTEVWRIESGGEPSEVFQYRGTTHDTSITKDNIITGPNAGAQVEPFWVSDSYPLRESNVVGELSLDTSVDHTVTVSSQSTWYEVNGNTIEGNESERTQQASNGTIQYIGVRDTNVHITVTSSFTGKNGDTYEIAIAKNGTVEPASTMEIQAGGQNASKSLSTTAIEDLQTGDTVSLQVRNVSSASDATFQAYTINFLGM